MRVVKLEGLGCSWVPRHGLLPSLAYLSVSSLSYDTSRRLGSVREAAEKERPKGDSGAKTSKQVCGGGDDGQSSSCSSPCGGTAWTRASLSQF